jgi:hypothetical protein
VTWGRVVSDVIIEPSKVSAMILSDACEDYHGLHEIISSLNNQFPDLPEESKREVAQEALGSLVKRRLVSLYTTTWPGGTYVAVPGHKAQAAIAASSSWVSPPAAPAKYYCFAATPEGEQAYSAGTFKVN